MHFYILILEAAENKINPVIFQAVDKLIAVSGKFNKPIIYGKQNDDVASKMNDSVMIVDARTMATLQVWFTAYKIKCHNTVHKAIILQGNGQINNSGKC